MYRNNAGKGVATRKTIQREGHALVLELHKNGVPKRFADWHYDIRRGRLNVFGGTLRALDEAIDNGRPDVAEAMVSLLHWYVRDRISPPTDDALRAA